MLLYVLSLYLFDVAFGNFVLTFDVDCLDMPHSFLCFKLVIVCLCGSVLFVLLLICVLCFYPHEPVSTAVNIGVYIFLN